MITEIKNFEQGVITDGDSPDMPQNTARKINNLDIDKTTQQLSCRLPFYVYENLATINEGIPTYQGYFVYNIIQYTDGIVIPQYNTMIIYRSILNSYDGTTLQPIEGKWNWVIADNSINGGDGFPFTKLTEEFEKTHCEPAAVLGKVRIALGNDTNYKILLNTDLYNYFRSFDLSFPGWLLTTPEVSPTVNNGLAALLQRQKGQHYLSSNGQKSYFFMEGRLYSNYNTSPVLNFAYKTKQTAPLPKGKYEIRISPVFDKDQRQFGACVSKTEFSILEDPKEDETLYKNSTKMQFGTKYKVNSVKPYLWTLVALSGIILEDVWGKTLMFSQNGNSTQRRIDSDYEGVCVVLEDNLYPNGSGGFFKKGDVFVFHQTYYQNYQPKASDQVTSEYTFEYRDPSTKHVTIYYPGSIPAGKVNTRYVTHKVIPTPFFDNTLLRKLIFYHPVYLFTDVDLDPRYGGTAWNESFEVAYQGTPYKKEQVFRTDNTEKQFSVYHKVENPPSYTLVDGAAVDIPYYINYARTNPNTKFLFYGKEFITSSGTLVLSPDNTPRIKSVAPNATWSFLYNQPLLEYQSSLLGSHGMLTFTVNTQDINPRIVEFAVFLRHTSFGLPESGDFALIDYLGVREDSDYIKYAWSPSLDPDGNLFSASTSIILDQTSLSVIYGSWAESYDLDGVYFRPYDHTEADITRKMNQITPVRNRMHAIGIDGDIGQEMVGRTPVCTGMPQLDVWYRPLVAHAGKGYAILSAIEFQDRLLWFQKNSLVYAAFGDSRRSGDYQFMNSGGGIGTHIKRSIAKSNDAVFFVNYDGIWRFDGSKPSDITIGRINDYWRYEVTKEQKDASFGGYNPKTNEYWLFIPYDPATFFAPFLQPWDPFDPTPDPEYTPPLEQLVTKGVIWIWDDNDFPSRSWRTYTLDPTRFSPPFNKKILGFYSGQMLQHTPTFFFADYDNNWIFVTHTDRWQENPNGNVFVSSTENLYFWPGENIQWQYPQFPIQFSLETQNLGTRAQDIIPDMFRLIGEDSPLDYTLTINVFRNNSLTDTETLTLTATNRRQRRLDRRRSSTLRFGVSGSYDPDMQKDPFVASGYPESIPTETYILRRPKIKEIHLGIVPNKRRT